jgi:hypothetical protein
MRSARLLLPVVAVILIGAAAPPVAQARTESASQGAVTATFSYRKSGDLEWTGLRLTIVRAGTTLFDGAPDVRQCPEPYCVPAGAFGTSGATSVRVRDLDGDGEPEVVLELYTGGAHCCLYAQVYRLRAGASGYDTTIHDFGDPGFALGDLDGDGRPEFRSADFRFDYAFSSFASSGMPVRIWRFQAGRFLDVTASFPARIRRDAALWWRGYRRRRARTDGEQLGLVAAWAGDEYRLGRRAHVLAVLRREARHGRLKGPGLHGSRFIRSLDRFLRRLGYRG